MRTTKRERALKLNVIRAQLLKLGIPQMLHLTLKVTSGIRLIQAITLKINFTLTMHF